jgi:hypothetical protein
MGPKMIRKDFFVGDFGNAFEEYLTDSRMQLSHDNAFEPMSIYFLSSTYPDKELITPNHIRDKTYVFPSTVFATYHFYNEEERWKYVHGILRLFGIAFKT